jgi:hypothetical protein
MAKIIFTKAYHQKMMDTKFDEDKLINILMWFDKLITPANTHKEIVSSMINVWKKIPKNKLTKAFMYQVFVFNGLIDDGIHDKDFCNQKWNCPILKYYKSLYPNIADNQVCWNLNACLLLPCFHIYPPYYQTQKQELILEYEE